MFEKSGHKSPSPGKNFRAAAFSGSMAGLSGEKALIVRRERLRHRRIKLSSLTKSKLVAADGEITPGGEKCRKRKRNGFSTSKKASILRLSSAPLPPLDQSPENDVIITGKSSLLSRACTRSVRCLSHGSISLIGRRREMEDALAVEPGFLQRGPKVYDFFGVYDGHGGSRVAHACRALLHKLVAKHVEEDGINYDEQKVIDWEKVMSSCFRKMDEEVNKDGSAVAMMGSTAVVAVVGEDKLVVANCGDSRAVLSRDGVAVPLSVDHKPDRPDELERIEVSGGKVINWNGPRVLGVLATSRSIGDQYLKPFVISEPEVNVTNRTDKDEFLILGCDGLWDAISNDDACLIVRKFLEGRVGGSSSEILNGNLSREAAGAGESSENAESMAGRAASLLAKLAIARGSRDNISVIVIELKRFGCCISPS